MEFIKIHQVLGDLEKDSNQFLIEVDKVDIDQEEDIEIMKHPDIKAVLTQVEGPNKYSDGENSVAYYRVYPRDWSYRWDEAKAAYGFMPREAVGERASDHLLYVKNKPDTIKFFKDQFNRLASDRKSTRPYIRDMLRKVDMALLDAPNIGIKDKEAIVSL